MPEGAAERAWVIRASGVMRVSTSWRRAAQSAKQSLESSAVMRSVIRELSSSVAGEAGLAAGADLLALEVGGDGSVGDVQDEDADGGSHEEVGQALVEVESGDDDE